MGGGVGISLPCRYRIATERTRFAMPEVGIGLFPDVGGSWHLPRLPQRSGHWLALTGARIAAADCVWLGIATQLVPSPALAALKAELTADPRAAGRTLAAAALPPQAAPLAAHQAELADCFAAESLEEVIARLERRGTAWAASQLQSIAGKSPQSLRVTWRLLQIGAQQRAFSACLALEYGVALRCVHAPDFSEGVRATLLDRDGAPRWQPPTLAEVTEAQLDALFEPLPADRAWAPLAG
jgi:enoyl-CoA hydratase